MATFLSVRSVVLVGALLGPQFPVQAVENPQVEAYRDNTIGGAALCLAKYEHFLLIVELRSVLSGPSEKTSAPVKIDAGGDSDYAGCRDEELKMTDIQYKALSKSARAGPKRDALKAIQIAFVATMKGLEARPSETTGEFRRRQGNLRSRLEDAWATFEVEN